MTYTYKFGIHRLPPEFMSLCPIALAHRTDIEEKAPRTVYQQQSYIHLPLAIAAQLSILLDPDHPAAMPTLEPNSVVESHVLLVAD